jgi:hypothetical protein
MRQRKVGAAVWSSKCGVKDREPWRTISRSLMRTGSSAGARYVSRAGVPDSELGFREETSPAVGIATRRRPGYD